MNAVMTEPTDADLNTMRHNVEGRIRILQRDNKNRERSKSALSELSRQLNRINEQIKQRHIAVMRSKYNAG